MWRLTSLLAALYTVVLVTFHRAGGVQAADLLENVAIVVGWVITVLVATHQLREARAENDRIKREELRKSLEIEALRHLVEAGKMLSSELDKIEARFAVAAFMLRRPPPLAADKFMLELSEDAMRYQIELLRIKEQYVFASETYQIALTSLEHYQKFIYFRIDDTARELGRLRRMMLVPLASMASDELRSAVREQAKAIANRLSELRGFVGDFRVEAMNALAGSLFGTSVSRRRSTTISPTLADLATPEAVAIEERLRQQPTRDASRDGDNSPAA